MASIIRAGSLLLALPCLFMEGTALAQAGNSSAPASDTLERLSERDALAVGNIVRSQGPIERNGFASPVPEFQLSTTSDKTEVSIGISTQIARSRSVVTGEIDRRVATSTRFSLQGFAPINENGEDTFVNFANPLSGSRLKFGFTHYVSRYTITPERRRDLQRVTNEAFSTCVRRRVSAWAAGRSADDRALAARYLARFEERMFRPSGQDQPDAESQIGELSAEFPTLPREVRDICRIGMIDGSPTANDVLIATYGDPTRVDVGITGVAGDAPIFFFGAEGTVSRKSYSFLDRTAFAIDDVDRTGYQGTAFAGIVGGTGRWSLRAGISHSRSYRDARKIELCQPVPGGIQTQCLSGPDGRPTRRQTTVLSLEGRQLFHLGDGLIPNIGIAPEFAYDFESDEFSIDFPIYFAGSEGRLNGGVRVSYSSEGDETVFGVFVGVPFTVFR
jgi:hypothetical protein